MPTKALIRSAEVMHLAARRAAEFGIEIEGPVRFNLLKAVARKDDIVANIIGGIYRALEGRRDAITFLRGQASFLDDHELDTGDTRLSFAKAIIATGARNVVPPIPGIDDIGYLTNRTALSLQELPSSMLIIGGGYIGVEFAQMYARFGTRVTLLGRNPQLLRGEDHELAELLAGYLREEGIDVRTGSEAIAVREEGGEKIVTALVDGAETEFRAEHLLMAAGRAANTPELGLDAAEVATDERGYVRVDDRLNTSRPHIWAIGDVKGGWMFTHVATYDGPIAALNAIRDEGRTVDYRVVPRAVFSDPTLAAVGLTESQAREREIEVAVGSVQATGARAIAMGETRGRLKVVTNAADGEILGVHILGHSGDILLHEAVVAMHGNGTIDRISRSIHVHPTLSEMVKAAAKAARRAGKE